MWVSGGLSGSSGNEEMLEEGKRRKEGNGKKVARSMYGKNGN